MIWKFLLKKKRKYLQLFNNQGSTDQPGMYSVFVAIGICGITATLLMPETFQEPLPECIEDVDSRFEFDQHNSIFKQIFLILKF
jgi:hypothetical protein